VHGVENAACHRNCISRACAVIYEIKRPAGKPAGPEREVIDNSSKAIHPASVCYKASKFKVIKAIKVINY
jgi:hypothetical protein